MSWAKVRFLPVAHLQGRLLNLAAKRATDDTVPVNRDMIDQAVEHRLQGPLSAWVQRTSPPVDEDARLELAKATLVARRKNRRLRDAARQVVAELADAGVRVAVIKGMGIESRWYADDGPRPAADLDLWIAPDQLDFAGRAVTRLAPEHPLAGKVDALVADRRLRSVDLLWHGVHIDLHFDPFKFGVWYEKLNDVWAANEDIGDGLTGMGAPAELVTALLHLNKDRFSRLLGFSDVVRIAADQAVVEKAWHLAREIGVTVPVACSAEVVNETLGVDIGLPPPPPGWRSALWRKLWPEETRLLGNDGYRTRRRRQDWIPLLCDERLRESVAFIGHIWFPPRELLDYFNPQVEGMSYPRALWAARVG